MFSLFIRKKSFVKIFSLKIRLTKEIELSIMNRKILLLGCFLLSVLIFVSCDGDCFEQDGKNYKNYIEKVAPGTQPVTTNDSEC